MRRFTSFCISFLLLFSFQVIYTQNPYSLSSPKDPLLLSSGTGIIGINILIGNSRDSLTEEQFGNLTPPNLNFIDKLDPKVLQRWDTKAMGLSDRLLLSSVALPVLSPLVGGKSSRHKMGVTYLIALEGILANIALTDLTKNIVRRKRPYLYNLGMISPEEKRELFKNQGPLKSFFSGHTSVVACNSFLAAKMLNDFYPDNDLQPAIWATAALIPAITGYLRVKAGKHFITDVLVGFVVGGTIGWVIPEIHK